MYVRAWDFHGLHARVLGEKERCSSEEEPHTCRGVPLPYVVCVEFSMCCMCRMCCMRCIHTLYTIYMLKVLYALYEVYSIYLVHARVVCGVALHVLCCVCLYIGRKRTDNLLKATEPCYRRRWSFGPKRLSAHRASPRCYPRTFGSDVACNIKATLHTSWLACGITYWGLADYLPRIRWLDRVYHAPM